MRGHMWLNKVASVLGPVTSYVRSDAEKSHCQPSHSLGNEFVQIAFLWAHRNHLWRSETPLIGSEASKIMLLVMILMQSPHVCVPISLDTNRVLFENRPARYFCDYEENKIII